MYVLSKTLQILHDGCIHFAEVYFFFTQTIGDELPSFALVSLYAPPNEHLLETTCNTLVVCQSEGETSLIVIDIKAILSVVAMIPFPYTIDGHNDQYFMIEKMGLDVAGVDALENDE